MYETSEESKVNCDQRAKCKSQISSVQHTSDQCAEAMMDLNGISRAAQPTLSAYSAVHTVGACIVFSQIPTFCTFYNPHCQPFCELLPVHTQFLDKPFLWKSCLKAINAGEIDSITLFILTRH